MNKFVAKLRTMRYNSPLHRQDEPNEPTKAGPLPLVLFESPFTSVSVPFQGPKKRLWSPGIDSKDSIPPVCVLAWRSGTTTFSYSVPSPQRLFKNSRSELTRGPPPRVSSALSFIGGVQEEGGNFLFQLISTSFPRVVKGGLGGRHPVVLPGGMVHVRMYLVWY